MKFYLQYGVPHLEPRWFLDSEVHPLSKGVEEVEAKDWKEARERIVVPTDAPE